MHRCTKCNNYHKCNTPGLTRIETRRWPLFIRMYLRICQLCSSTRCRTTNTSSSSSSSSSITINNNISSSNTTTITNSNSIIINISSNCLR